jgi:hypothetical protein
MSFHKGKNSWVRRRWFDFRQGHSIYLAVVIMFANFITLKYSLMIERIPAFSTVLGNPVVFALAFLGGYMPLAIAIGHWHKKSQWKVEQEAMFSENVVQARLWLFMIRLVQGKTTEAEQAEMQKMLEKIIKKLPKGATEVA